MNAYRLTHSRYADDLSGFGAYKTGGRWNPKGYYALYLSEHPCGAILEILIHMPPQILPEDYSLIIYNISDTAEIVTIEESELPSSWRQGGFDLVAFQEFGRKHLFDANKLGLKIHSSVAYPSHNYILNPKHEKFNVLVKISDIKKYVFDSRLIQLFKTGIR